MDASPIIENFKGGPSEDCEAPKGGSSLNKDADIIRFGENAKIGSLKSAANSKKKGAVQTGTKLKGKSGFEWKVDKVGRIRGRQGPGPEKKYSIRNKGKV